MIKKSSAALIASSLLSFALLPLAGCTVETSTSPDAPSSEDATAPEVSTTEEPATEPPASLLKIRDFIASKTIDKTQSTWKSRLPKPPKLRFKDETIFWNLDTTEGDIRIKLMPDVAPMHVSNLMYLTELGFYDDLFFHRVMAGFMAQGGCPNGNGMGNPGYKFGSEVRKDVSHDRAGLLSAANLFPTPNTDGSQFFLTFSPQTHLDMRHTIYGEVVDGMDVLKKLDANSGTRANGGRPKKKMIINSATISYE